MRYDLVIFDNDGVLVDSEPIANQILAGYLTELGHPTTYQDSVRDFMGAAVHRVHDLIRERTGRELPAEFDVELQARTLEAFRRELRPVAGMPRVLDELDAEGVPYCLASSATHERIRAALRTVGLDDRFGALGPLPVAPAMAGAGAAPGPDAPCRVFSAQDVGRGKPAPDLFLHAAGTMGVPPERCVVVEDSPLGVRAAVAAGMDVFGFTVMTPPDRLSGATALFDDPQRLVELLLGPGPIPLAP
ncbi:hydrolase [Wenjunlia vitaminophila]|uniref:Hydrolase n=1 Tax=Wenjunlia vitaminophila TaxID=76728 RepID=A0A0T6LXN2_WENVI|nr:HAD family hydrolase [Wenjunlia vitaminophila]KRV50931.1 hydrolase [Wenjunlia vitaminophila]